MRIFLVLRLFPNLGQEEIKDALRASILLCRPSSDHLKAQSFVINQTLSGKLLDYMNMHDSQHFNSATDITFFRHGSFLSWVVSAPRIGTTMAKIN